MAPIALALLLLLAPAARAAPPAIQPQTLQCGETYANGTTTNHPNPVLQAVITAPSGGVMIGQQPLVARNGNVSTWNFNTSGPANSYTIAQTNGGTAFDVTCGFYTTSIDFTWSCAQTGQSSLQYGRCLYTYNTGICDYVLASEQQPVDMGSCPATPTLTPGTTNLTSVGKFGLGLKLNGSQWADTPETAAYQLPGSYTLSAWVNTTVGAGNQRIISTQNTGYWVLGLNGTSGVRHCDSRDGTPCSIVTGPVLQNTGWHLVTVVRSNGADRRFFVDGALIGTAPASTASPFGTIGASPTIGRFSGGGESFTGTLDDVRVINTNISDDEVRAEYNATVHRYSAAGPTPTTYVQGTYVGTPTNGATPVTYRPGEAYTATNVRQIIAANAGTAETTVSPVLLVSRDSTPPSATPIQGTPASATSITWSWSTPARVCATPTSGSVGYYIHDTVTGATMTSVQNALSVTEGGLAGPNVIAGRLMHITDIWGSGLLGTAATAYTLSNAPTTIPLVSGGISTGSVSVSWGANSNPSYTRYGVTYSADQPTPFAVTTSTRLTVGSDYTGTSIGIDGLQPGTTYGIRVQAFNGRSSDPYGTAASAFLTYGFTTRPIAPAISGTAISNTAIDWAWTNPSGTAYFNAYSSTGLYYSGGKNTLAANNLAQNAAYQFFVEAVAPAPSGAGAQSSAYVYTLALPPVAAITPVIGKTSATFAWGANGNPGYTYYEVSVATDAVFGAVIATMTTTGTSLTVNDLFPATTYYARVRALNGDQIYTAYANFANVVTDADPFITNNAAPPSPYVPINGLVGQWHFDVNSGTTTPDTSGVGNAAAPACLSAGCVSTPTYVAGPANLGGAVTFGGLVGSLVRVPDHAAYNFAADLTVVAWVRPDSVSQPNGAGLVVRGDGGAEDFALEISGGLYRFLAKPGFVASSTNTIQAGVWTHLVAVYDDAATGSATLYVNGQPANAVTGVGARNNFAHLISIGNRQSGATLYDRGFLGRIDGVRVFSRAMTAGEALSEFNGNFASTITPITPNAGIQVGLPPNGFGAPAIVYVSADPANHPIRISPAQLAAGLAATPTGYVLVPNTVVEVVPMVGGSAYTQSLGSSATITIPYADADGDDVVDSSDPPLAASRILAFTLNTMVNRWEPLPTYVNRSGKHGLLWTPHFSVFALFAPAVIGSDLSQVRVYPVPWKPGSGGRFDASGVTFDRLPVSGKIAIHAITGEKVADIPFSGAAAGVVVWDGRNDGGRRTASGVYFARVTSDDGARTLLRFAIER